jgi:hypothetical protein
VVECDCGERPILSASQTVCSCGTDHAALIRKALASQRAPHPWDAEYDEWRKKQDEYSEEAAQEFLSLSSLPNGWYVRGFSGGELVSLLFAFSARMKGVLLDPHPGALSGDVAVSVVGRNAFVSSLHGS